MLFDRLAAGTEVLATLQGTIDRLTHTGVIIIDVVHERIELLRGQQGAHTKVTDGLVSQQEPHVLLGRDAVGEDQHRAIEGVAGSHGSIEISLRTRCHCALVEVRVTALEISLVLVDEELRSLGKTTAEPVHDSFGPDRVDTLGRATVLIHWISHSVKAGQHVAALLA